MSRLGYHDNYDLFTLNGASLGVVGSGHIALPGTGNARAGFFDKSDEHWDQTFLDMLYLSANEHDISKLIVVDHIGCGCYDAYYERDSHDGDDPSTRVENIKQHFTNMRNFCNYIGVPLEDDGTHITGYLMDTDGALCS